jgi:uncharacterized protein (DUF1330 family)
MLILVQIDISQAKMPEFEAYEAQVLALLGNHGATLVERLRSTDGKREVHLLDFPDPESLDAFRADPARAALQDLWLQCGASSSLSEVRRLTGV